MIDLDREIRALLEDQVRRTPPLPDATPIVLRTRRRQVVTVLSGVVVAAVITIASILAAGTFLRAHQPDTPVDPPDALTPGSLQAAPVGTAFGDPVIAADGTVWWVGPGLSRFDPATGATRTFTVADDPAFGDVWPVVAARDGGVWIRSDAIRRFDGEAFRATLPLGPIAEIAEGPDGTVWGTGSDGLFRWDGETWVPVPSEGLPLEGTVAVDEGGGVWVANLEYPGPKGYGVSRFDGTSWMTWTTRDGLPSDEVYAISPTPGGDVWIGTADGVARFRDGSWVAYPATVSGVQHAIFIAATDREVVVAGREGGRDAPIARFDGSTWRSFTAKDGLDAVDGGLIGVAAGPDGVWATTDAGLFRLDGTRWEKLGSVGAGPPADAVRARDTVIAAVDDDTVWVATAEQGIWRLDGERWTLVGLGTGPTSGRVNDLMIATDGTVWAATEDGLLRLGGSRWEEIASGRFGAVASAPDGAIWVARAISPDDASWQVGPVEGPPLPGSAEVDLYGPRALVIDGTGEVWIGSGGGYLGGGLAHFDGQRWRLIDRATIAPDLPDDPGCSFRGCRRVAVSDIVTVPGGDTWIVFAVTGLRADTLEPSLLAARFDGERWHTISRDADGALLRYGWHTGGDLDVTTSGSLLLASGEGLLEYRDGSWHSVQAGAFAGLSTSPEGTTWLAGDGLFRLPPR